MTVLATDNFDLAKTRDLATLLYGSVKAEKTGARTLVVYAQSEHTEIGVTLVRVGRNLGRVGITHTGALDVKDVLGYARLVLTTAAFDELGAAFAERAKKESAA